MRYGHDVLLEKVVENDHVLFLPKKYVVRQVLDNFSDEKEATSNSQVTRRSRDVDSLWGYDCWTDEAGEYIKLIWSNFWNEFPIYRKNKNPPTAAYLLSGHCCDLNTISPNFGAVHGHLHSFRYVSAYLPANPTLWISKKPETSR
jgi:hypothetical protein